MTFEITTFFFHFVFNIFLVLYALFNYHYSVYLSGNTVCVLLVNPHRNLIYEITLVFSFESTRLIIMSVLHLMDVLTVLHVSSLISIEHQTHGFRLR